MGNATHPVQAGLKAALDAIGTIAGVGVVPVYDVPPQDEPTEYILIGRDTGIARDTKTFTGMEHSVSIDIYCSRKDYEGFALVKLIVDAVYDALHRQTITVSGFEAFNPRLAFQETFAEPDGTRGTMRFTINTF